MKPFRVFAAFVRRARWSETGLTRQGSWVVLSNDGCRGRAGTRLGLPGGVWARGE